MISQLHAAMPRGLRFTRPSFLLLLATTLSAGFVIAAGGLLAVVPLGLAGALLILWLIFGQGRAEPVRERLGVEVPVLLLLIAGINLRSRDASELASNPLDGAGIFMVGCTGLAALLGVSALLRPRHALDRHPLLPLPAKLYAGYVMVVLLGTLTSVNPLLTGYRGFELVAGLLAVSGAIWVAGRGALLRIGNVIYWWIALRLLVVWKDVLLFPGQALNPTNPHVSSPIRFRIAGVYPDLTYNTVGIFGAYLALWAAARAISPDRSARQRVLHAALSLMGVASIVGAQYRTGYAVLAVGFPLLALMRRRSWILALALVGVLIVGLWGPRAFQTAEPYVLRGQSREQASRLSGRLYWWSLALPVWRDSPWIGGGLRTASRFLVLAAAGFGETGAMHGTWVEALVGTGAIGLALLLASLLTAWWRSLLRALEPGGQVVPLMLLTAMVIRSTTGNTIEDSGVGFLLFLTLAFGLSRIVPPSGADRTRLATPNGDVRAIGDSPVVGTSSR